MASLTIPAEAKPTPNASAVRPPVSVTIESGDHIVMTRKVDREQHRAMLRRLLDEMNSRGYDPKKETAEDILNELRNQHE